MLADLEKFSVLFLLISGELILTQHRGLFLRSKLKNIQSGQGTPQFDAVQDTGKRCTVRHRRRRVDEDEHCLLVKLHCGRDDSARTSLSGGSIARHPNTACPLKVQRRDGQQCGSSAVPCATHHECAPANVGHNKVHLSGKHSQGGSLIFTQSVPCRTRPKSLGSEQRLNIGGTD